MNPLIPLLLLVALAQPAAAGELAAVEAPPPRYRDAIPAPASLQSRLAEIARRVQRASHYPAIARERGVIGETVVAFEIGADGAPRDVGVETSSGSGALDRAAVRAVVEATPLPVVQGRVRVPVRFELEPAN